MHKTLYNFSRGAASAPLLPLPVDAHDSKGMVSCSSSHRRHKAPLFFSGVRCRRHVSHSNNGCWCIDRRHQAYRQQRRPNLDLYEKDMLKAALLSTATCWGRQSTPSRLCIVQLWQCDCDCEWLTADEQSSASYKSVLLYEVYSWQVHNNEWKK